MSPRRTASVKTVLLLGGTGEGRRLAALLAGRDGVRVISSLAGRVRSPWPVEGEVRVGGFGGVDGLLAYLAAERVDAIVDATHPHAGRMTANAAEASRASGVPLLILHRPGWHEQAGDTWHRVPTLDAVPALLPSFGEHVFLTTGRQGLATFADCPQAFVVRSVDPPGPPMPARIEVILDRGPFTLDAELELLRRYAIDVLVTKDSGGGAAAPKLEAARRLSVPVLMVDRPPLPADVSTVDTVAAAVAWLDAT
jgi:precorrin-6A/cobalt-precorrin-6A reductase